MSDRRTTASHAAPWLALGLVVVVALVWAAWPDPAPSVRERAHDLASELRCPDCEGLSVADSATSSARAIRADLRRRIAAGESVDDVRQEYVDRFGESILLNPEGGGLGLLVWGLPVLVLVLGAGGLVVALRRWRREPQMHATQADEDLVARARTEHVEAS
jgi:cytochrome c-type biogenesis protein CcmH